MSVILSDGLVGSSSGSVSAYGDSCYACASGKALYHAGDESDDYWCVPLTLVMRAMLLMPAGMTSFTLVIGVVLPSWVRVPRMPTPCVVPILVGAAGSLGR